MRFLVLLLLFSCASKSPFEICYEKEIKKLNSDYVFSYQKRRAKVICEMQHPDACTEKVYQYGHSCREWK